MIRAATPHMYMFKVHARTPQRKGIWNSGTNAYARNQTKMLMLYVVNSIKLHLTAFWC